MAATADEAMCKCRCGDFGAVPIVTMSGCFYFSVKISATIFFGIDKEGNPIPDEE
jgi:hypothetical protein